MRRVVVRLLAFAILLASGCIGGHQVGGQSGDDGLGGHDDEFGPERGTTVTAGVPRCSGETLDASVPSGAACMEGDGGFVCACEPDAGPAERSDAGTCEEALRERCARSR